MNSRIITTAVAIASVLSSTVKSSAQEQAAVQSRPVRRQIVFSGRPTMCVGAGTGVDFGGYGLRLTAQPHENFGFNVGLGFWGAGFPGIALAAQARLLPKPYKKIVCPYATAGFGTVSVGYRGMTMGPFAAGGIDFFNMENSPGYLNGGLIAGDGEVYLSAGLHIILARKK